MQFKSTQVDELIGGHILSTVPNRFWGDHRCDAMLIMPPTHITSRVMIETARTCCNVRSADVFSSAQLTTNLTRNSQTMVQAIKLAVEKHEINRVFLFRHQGIEDGKIYLRPSERYDEDRARISGLIKARDHLLRKPRNVADEANCILGPNHNIKVVMVYARFVDGGRLIQLSQINPDHSEIIRMTADNRFMSEDGKEMPCEATVITCMDFRQFREVRNCVYDDYDYDRVGIIGMPGASKRFNEDGIISWNAFYQAMEKHGSNKFLIFHHGDCGAYGGLDAFNGDTISEELMHRKEMYRLRDKIIGKKHGVEVELVYARFIEGGRRIRFVRFD
jgi:hypothetical protein